MDTDTFATVMSLAVVLVLYGAAMVMAAKKSSWSMGLDRKVYRFFLYTFSTMFLADVVLMIWLVLSPPFKG